MDIAEVFDQRVVQRKNEIVGARRAVVLLRVEPARGDVGVPGQHHLAARNDVSVGLLLLIVVLVLLFKGRACRWGAAGSIAGRAPVFFIPFKMRNLQSKVPDAVWPEFKARAAACYQAASPALARLLRDDIATTYETELPSAVACLDDDFEACIAHLRFLLGHRRAIRTTNLLERLFGEARRRTKVIPHVFGERAVLKLIYAALIRAAERWRGIKITEFEQRQLKAIREEINQDFTARNTPAPGATVTATPTRLSSYDRT